MITFFSNRWLIYRFFWVNYLVYHCFFSTSTFLPLSYRLVILITGVLSLLFHKSDVHQYGLMLHKTIFIALSFYPFAFDNRTILAVFESIVIIFIIARKKSYASVDQSHLLLMGLAFFFAGFHKLNTEHLFSSGSCSYSFFESLFGRVESASWMHLFPIWTAPSLVIALEILVPLLIFLRAHSLALIFVSVFQVSITLLGFSQFSALIWVLALPLYFNCQKEFLKMTLAMMWLAAGAFLIQEGTYGDGFATLGCGVFLVILSYIKFSPLVMKETTDKTLVMILAVFVLNCFSIYLGYKNQGTMSMYSNLKIMPEGNNHILMPDFLRISDNLVDTVKLISSDQSVHQYALKNEGELPLKLFKSGYRYWLGKNIIPQITYVYQGQQFSLKSRVEMEDFIKDLSWWDYHFLTLALVYPHTKACHW
ncbi:MAG: hypothetical protein LW878_09735 [Proteobacteria bacterium]|nr:hypothetical protein [Pseudomonadota bacterium]